MKHAREGGTVRYRARVEYDGTEFAGFQAQPGRRTVQGELERVLAHLSGEPTIRIKSAGRTDAGVHATGQVIAFTWHGGMAAKELGQAIGALLPPDVAIGSLARVALDFDPRRAATRREYRYSIWTGPRRPFGRHTVYELDEPDGSSPADGVSRPSKPYVPPDRGFGHDGYPAIGMTIDAAEGFCRWLSLKTGLEFRLPARQEWTYLAAGESLAAYCCDVEADSLDRVAWFVDNSKFSTHAVGEKRPNLFGLYDIHGNASEWVTSDSRKPIALGGSFRDDADECTSTSFQQQLRSWNTSDPQIPKSSWWLADCSWVGFRFVIEADTIDQSILQELTDE